MRPGPVGGVVGLTLLCCGPAVALPAESRAVKAELVLRDGTVHTVTGRDARAVAVRHGRIVYVGDDRGVTRFIGRHTEVVDLNGRSVLPGLVDGHIHLQPMLPSCDLRRASLTVPQIQRKIRSCLEATKDKEPDGWLRGENWSLQTMRPAGARPVKAVLDELDTRRPIRIRAYGYHSAWLNSRALRLLGITRNTPNPPDGEIVRDSRGEPTGHLKDGAAFLAEQRIPPVPLRQRVAGLRKALRQVTTGGLTAYSPQMMTEPELEAWKYLADRHEIPGHAVGSLYLDFNEAAKDIKGTVRRVEELRRKYSGPGFRVAAIGEVFADGVMGYSIQTARLLEPYRVEQGGKWVPGPSRGPTYIRQSRMNEVTAALDKAGFQVQFHAMGDGAVRQALDAFTHSRKVNGRTGRRHVIAHAQLVDPSDYRRFGRLDVSVAMALQWALRELYTMGALKPYLGGERWRRMYPARSILDAGGNVTNGSDYPIDPLAPMLQLQLAMTRTNPAPSRSAYRGPLGPRERLTFAQALRVHTLNSAYQLHLDKLVGSIEVGKRADLIVLDRNLLRTPAARVRHAKVKATLIGGRIKAGRLVQVG